MGSAHHAHLLAKPLEVERLELDPVEEDAARGRVVEALQQVTVRVWVWVWVRVMAEGWGLGLWLRVRVRVSLTCSSAMTVDLPEPDGPHSAQTWPGCTSSVRPVHILNCSAVG